MKSYVIRLTGKSTDTVETFVRVEANSVEEAASKAISIAIDDLYDDWNWFSSSPKIEEIEVDMDDSGPVPEKGSVNGT